jgi:hypothetical protein
VVVDGSTDSLAAVRTAATEAVERGGPLRIAHAYIGPSLGVATGPGMVISADANGSQKFATFGTTSLVDAARMFVRTSATG